MNWTKRLSACCAIWVAGLTTIAAAADSPLPPLIRSVQSGDWSAPATWEAGHLPAKGERVLIRPQDRVTYDIVADYPLWSVHVAGTLAFAADRDTRMDVGVLMIQPGDDGTEESFVDRPHDDGMADMPGMKMAKPSPAALEIGTAETPIDPAHHALIRLTYQPGMDKNSYPALVCMGGRIDLHGSPLNHSWTKIRSAVTAGDSTIALDEPPIGWRAGDRVVVPTTILPKMFDGNEHVIDARKETQTEERVIKTIEGQLVTLDRPLAYDHYAQGDNRDEIADLSRNITIESADPDSEGGALRGHTMVHAGSQASFNYAEFRHLGKPGQLGRYALHFHMGGDSLRGSSVIGCSIWDSDNRFMTVHGTNYLVVRDNVGYRSLGHGFFLENGTEVYNVFDRNLAIQALRTAPLPDQILPFDKNDGAGFWWANSLNTFTSNVAVECDQYGFRFEMDKPPIFDAHLPVRQPDGTSATVDVRTLPFVRFADNEAHSNRRYAMNLGGFRLVAGNDGYSATQPAFDKSTALIGDVGDVGPDLHHPFYIRNFRVWRCFWAFHSAAPSVYIDGLNVYDTTYGIWRTRMDHHQYKNISFQKMGVADIYNPWGGSDDFTQDFNKTVKLVDDLPPQTIITQIEHRPDGDIDVTGTTADNAVVTKVMVNGQSAKAYQPNFSQWTVELPNGDKINSITAVATDAAGNVEKTPHTITLSPGK